MSDIAELGVKVTSSGIDQTTNKLKDLEKATKGAENSSEGAGSSFSKMGGMAAIAATAVTALAVATYKASMVIIDAQKEIDKLNRGFTVLAGGDTVAAAKNIAWIREESKRLGLEVSDASDSFLKWQGSIKGTSLEGEAGRRIFSAFAGAAANLGSSAENTNGILSALGQMASKGVVSMEELRGQLGDRMPGAMQIAARSMNVTTAELVKMVSEGKVASETFLMGFASQVEKEMGTGGQQVDTMTAAMNRFGNAWNERMQAIANSGFGAMLKDLVSDMAKLIGVDSAKTKAADAVALQRKELEALQYQLMRIEALQSGQEQTFQGQQAARSGAYDKAAEQLRTQIALIGAKVKASDDEAAAEAENADISVAKSKLKAAQAAKEAEAKAAQAKADKEAEKVKKQLIQAIQDEKDALEIANAKLKEGELAAYRLTLAKKGMVGATQNELVALKAQNIALEQQTEADKKAKDAAQASADLYAGKLKDARVSYLRLTEDYNAKAQEELGITDALNPKVQALAAAYQKAADAKKLVSQSSKIDDTMASIRVDIATTGGGEISQAQGEAAKLQETLDARNAVIDANYQLEQQKLAEQLASEQITKEEFYAGDEERYMAYLERKSLADDAYRAKKKQSDDSLQAIQTKQQVTTLNQSAQFFGNMASIAQMAGKEGFQRYKNLSSAQAAISAAASVVQVLGDATVPAWVKVPLATSIGALGIAQVAQIQAQEYSGRAAGGQMLGGATYRVNENGDELITTKDGGAVTSAKVINQLIAAAQNNGGGVIINNYSSAEFTQRKTSNGLTVFDVRDIARETVSSDIASGGNAISSAAESTWGLNRAAGA